MANHRMVYRIVFLAIALLALPYLVDVAFYGDFTPTHYAQETSLDEPLQDVDGRDSTLIGDDHTKVSQRNLYEPTLRSTFRHDLFAVRAISPFEYLMSASLLSLPPPALLA